jgi:hypothetical protein
LRAETPSAFLPNLETGAARATVEEANI